MSKGAKYILAFACLLLVLVSWESLSDYLQLSLSVDNIWLLMLPFTVYIRKAGKKSSFYFFPALLCLLCHYFIPSPFFILMAVCFAIFWIVEQHLGKLNQLAPVVIILIAPLTEYFFEIFGFPIRLKLTELAGVLLQKSGMGVEWQGNQILLEGKEFSVDPACIGLNMVITSFLISVLILSSMEQYKKKELSLKTSILYLFVATFLILFTNLIRIILLVVLRSHPESFSHQLIGIICLCSLTIVPLLLLAYYLVNKSKTDLVKEKSKIHFTAKSVALYAVLLIGLLASRGLSKDYVDIPEDEVANAVQLNGLKKEVLENNIVKFYNEAAIVYIKPSKGIFRSNHNPRVCWKGSGYEFKKEKIEAINDFEIYTAELHLEDKILYTAWWYDNGLSKTNSQMEWRWKVVQGEPDFRMINVTSDNKKELRENVEKVIRENLFVE